MATYKRENYLKRLRKVTDPMMAQAEHPFGLDEIISRYTESQCWALALELNALTSFPFVFLVGVDIEPEDEFPEWASWAHALVETPDGRWLDILGQWDPTDALLHYESTEGMEIFYTMDQDGITSPGWGIQYDSELDHKVAVAVLEILSIPLDKEPVFV